MNIDEIREAVNAQTHLCPTKPHVCSNTHRIGTLEHLVNRQAWNLFSLTDNNDHLQAEQRNAHLQSKIAEATRRAARASS